MKQLCAIVLITFGIVVPHQAMSQLPTNIIKSVDWHPFEPLIAVVVDVDGDFVTKTPDEVWLYDDNLVPLIQLSMPQDVSVQSIRWSSDGYRLGVIARTLDFAVYQVYQWDTANPYQPVLITGFESIHPTAADIDWSPNHQLIAVNSYDDIVIWDIAANQEVSRIESNMSPDFVANLAWHPTTNLLAASGAQSVIVWDTSQAYSPVATIATTGGIEDIVWSPPGNMLAVAINDIVEIWEWNTSSSIFEKSYTLTGQANDIGKLDWQQDRLASIGWDSVVSTGTPIHGNLLVVSLFCQLQTILRHLKP